VTIQHSLPFRPGFRARLVTAIPWTLLALAVADWALLKAGWWTHPPALLAGLVGAATLGLAVRFVVLVRRFTTGAAKASGTGLARGAELMLIAGLLTALGAGTANWLQSLQGFVVLHEGESVPLGSGHHLQELVGGPLARIEEMNLVVGLAEVELLPVDPEPTGGARSFVPRSRLVVRGADRESHEVDVEPQRVAAIGPLRFHQGAFGFAPRIVIERNGRTVFDEVVPFTTERRGPTGVAFEGAFTLARESLQGDGRIDLASLDEGMRGHATLDLAVRRQGALLGRGRLLPGHFATIDDGYRVGFAGLERWSEIDISRRGYPEVLLTGAGLAVLGLLGLIVAAVRCRVLPAPADTVAPPAPTEAAP